MKLVLSLLFLGSFGLFTCGVGGVSPVDSNSLLGDWKGRNENGKAEVLLTVNSGDLVFKHGENGESTRHSYALYDRNQRKEMKIEGFDELFIVNFVDEGTMRLDLTEVDARKVSAPVITMVTFYRRK